MPWVRLGDSAATYPPLMSLAADPAADERTVNEATGWLLRCAFQSGAHLTDYVIDLGTAYMLGGARTDELVRMCVAAGLLTETVTSSGFRAWKLVADPEFVHLRLREEIEWERQQRRDTRDPHLTVPVRLRDGDQCRWCGVLVQWRGKRTARTGSVDHLDPGKAGTVATLVVACTGCNGARKNNAELWADNHSLRPVPKAPRYGRWTAEFLAANGYPVQQNVHSDDERPASQAGTSQRTASQAEDAPLRDDRPADPAGDGDRPPTAAGDGKTGSPITMPPGTRPELSSELVPEPVRTGKPGSGREGTDIGSGRSRDGPGSGRDGSGSGRSRRRRPRRR